jgi:hypothetical protein
MTLVDKCPKCGGEVWDNTADVKAGQKTPVWRCRDQTCKDARGYVTSDWTPNEELKAAYDQRMGTAPPTVTEEDGPPPWLTEPDPDLRFPSTSEDRWVESMSTILRAVDRVENEKGWRPDNDAMTRMVITEYLKTK